jgi:uncharacterized protein (TIGR02145 family)
MKLVFGIFIGIFAFQQLFAQQSFESVTIGEKTWMVENLNVITFRNGDEIPEVTDQEEWLMAEETGQPAWCYYSNDVDNGKTYGVLYNWHAVNDSRGLAPEGWHVASEEEWEELESNLLDINKENINKQIKSKTGWDSKLGGSNSSGFNALPGGQRKVCGAFDFMGQDAQWWTSTGDDDYGSIAKGVGELQDDYMKTYYSAKHEGMYVRCVKD